MLDYEAAKAIAKRGLQEGLAIEDTLARELRTGWYFNFIGTGEPLVGGNGVIVNKVTGKVFTLSSGSVVERDLDFYDRGYQFHSYDFVILEVTDREATLDALEQLMFMAVEPKYDRGTVWRVPRYLSRKELAQRIEKLPCVFGAVGLYSREEVLESARTTGIFRFEALEYQAPR